MSDFEFDTTRLDSSLIELGLVYKLRLSTNLLIQIKSLIQILNLMYFQILLYSNDNKMIPSYMEECIFTCKPTALYVILYNLFLSHVSVLDRESPSLLFG